MLWKWLQQQMGERQPSLKRRKKPQENPTCCNICFLLLLFLLGFGFLSLYGGCDYNQFLAVLCPRVKRSTDGAWVGTQHRHCQQRCQEVKRLPHLTSPWAAHLLQTSALSRKQVLQVMLWEVRAKVIYLWDSKKTIWKSGGVSATIAGLVKAGDCFHYENRGRVAGWSWLFGWKNPKYPLWYFTSELMWKYTNRYGCYVNNSVERKKYLAPTATPANQLLLCYAHVWSKVPVFYQFIFGNLYDSGLSAYELTQLKVMCCSAYGYNDLTYMMEIS